MSTRIEILDSNLNLVTWVQSPYELDTSGNILQYSKELSDYGQCKFRLSNYDPAFTKFGDITQPHKYHVRINRNGSYVWQGAIIENSKRTKDFTEVIAAEYLWYLGRVLINRTSTDPNDSTSKTNIFRIFNSGTMKTAVTAIINETIAKYQSTNHALASLSLGTVENPNYPPNITNGSNPPAPLKGAWSFGNGVTAPMLTFDFHTVLYVLKAFGAYTYADFNIDSSLRFNFKKFLGNDKHYDVNFAWGEHGNAVDFNITRLGQRQVNTLWGVAANSLGHLLIQSVSDQPAVKVYGLLEQVAAYTDIKDQATLNARTQAELPFISTPEQSADTFVLDEKAYPLGLYDIGDIITAKVDHTAVSYKAIKRIVGISVSLHNTGRELTTVQLNTPLPWEYGSKV